MWSRFCTLESPEFHTIDLKNLVHEDTRGDIGLLAIQFGTWEGVLLSQQYFTPYEAFGDLAKYKAQDSSFNIEQVHFFPLGGIKRAAEFVEEFSNSNP